MSSFIGTTSLADFTPSLSDNPALVTNKTRAHIDMVSGETSPTGDIDTFRASLDSPVTDRPKEGLHQGTEPTVNNDNATNNQIIEPWFCFNTEEFRNLAMDAIPETEFETKEENNQYCLKTKF